MSEAWKLRRHVDKRDGSSSGWIVFTPEGPITYEIGTPLTENTARQIAAAPELVRELKRLHRQRVKNRVAWGIPCGDLEKTDILIDAAEGGRKYPCNRIDGETSDR